MNNHQKIICPTNGSVARLFVGTYALSNLGTLTLPGIVKKLDKFTPPPENLTLHDLEMP